MLTMGGDFIVRSGICFPAFCDQAFFVEFKGQLDLNFIEGGEGSIHFLPIDFLQFIPCRITR